MCPFVVNLISRAMNAPRDAWLLSQTPVRHRAQFFRVCAEISQEVTPLFFSSLGCLCSLAIRNHFRPSIGHPTISGPPHLLDGGNRHAKRLTQFLIGFALPGESCLQ